MKKTLLTILIFMFAIPVLAAEFSADMVTVAAGRSITGKMYFKDAKTHRTEIMGIASITKHPFVYQVFGKTRKYVQTDIREAAEQNPMADVSSVKEWISKNNMKKVGKETIGGYSCVIYQGQVPMNQGSGSIPMKIWYTKKLDYPVKYEVTLQAPMGTVTGHLANIQKGKQDRGLFEIPAGFTQAANVQEAMGMPSFSMPSMPNQGGAQKAGGQAPSPEQMEQMMGQMKKMMQGGQQQ